MDKKAIFLIAALFSTPASAASIRCAVVDSSNNILNYRLFEDACPPDLPQKGLKWLPAPVTVPSYDQATQVLEGPVISVGPTQVTTTYTVRDKTAQELAAEADAVKEAKLNSVDLFVLKTLCDHESRIRVLESKPAITLAQCRAAIKAALP